MKTFQAICVLLVAGIVSACEEGADIVGVGKYCYTEGDKIVTCSCPFSHCEYEPNALSRFGIEGKCQLSDDGIVFITFWILFGVITTCLVSWLCCCRGDGLSFRGFCTGGFFCATSEPPTEKKVTVVSNTSVSNDTTTISTATTSVSTAETTSVDDDNSPDA